VLGRVWSGWRRGLGVRPVPEDAGFGTEARTSSDVEQATGSTSDRKTRRADIVLSAARAEPVPRAREAGASGCPSIWEVSGRGDRKLGVQTSICGEETAAWG
ncbi:RPUSD3 isoform 11, partial [Pongo abelii]